MSARRSSAHAFDPALADFHNEGTMRAIKVLAPSELVVNCEYPSTWVLRR